MNSTIARKLVQWFKQSEQVVPPSSETEALSPREMEVLELLTQGFAYKEIADKLKVTYSTVQTYIERIYKRQDPYFRGDSEPSRGGHRPTP
jgi:DNA-binding NarL/FixJ family response regulator